MSFCQLLFCELQKFLLFYFMLTLKLNLFEVKRAFLQMFDKMPHWENDKLTKWLCSYIIMSTYTLSTSKSYFILIYVDSWAEFKLSQKGIFTNIWQNATLGKWQVDKMTWRRREGKLWNVKNNIVRSTKSGTNLIKIILILNIKLECLSQASNLGVRVKQRI